MLARYCLVALAALSVIVEAGGSRGRNVNIRSSNRFAPSRKSYNSNNRLNVNSRSSKLSNKRQVTIKPKKLSFSNKQRFASQSNSKRSHTNSNTGLQNNNFAKSIVSPVKNFNRINAHNYAKVEDNDQDSHQTVKSGTLNINGNLQFNSEDGIIPSATASPQSIAALSAPGGAAPALEDTATPEGDTTPFLQNGFIDSIKEAANERKGNALFNAASCSSLPPPTNSKYRGLDNAGKTTILKRINGEDISTISPTLGFNIKTLFHDQYTLNIWDVGGQLSLRSYWRNYFEQTDALIWVVDASDRMRLNDCQEELHKLLMEERLLGASLLIFANKQDLQGALTGEEITKVLKLNEIVTHRYHIQECSAVTGENLLTGMDWLVKDVAERLYTFS